jgi:ubiquitin-protein ligase
MDKRLLSSSKKTMRKKLPPDILLRGSGKTKKCAAKSIGDPPDTFFNPDFYALDMHFDEN